MLDAFSRDASLFEIRPEVVVAPKDTRDVEALVQAAVAGKKRQFSLTPRSAGTDMTGGPLTDSVVVDMKRHFTKIGHVNSAGTVVQPGVFYRDFEQATLKHDLLLPCYPASRELCTVGGMVANNAGGEKSLSYGKTERFVERLKVVLADGKEHVIEPLDDAQLKERIARRDFLGKAYGALDKLLTQHEQLLANAKPHARKNSAGYGLWNMRDPRTKRFDPTQLFVGSQGTLGIMTEITFRLVHPKPHHRLLVIPLRNLSKLGEIITTVLKFHPESFESYDDEALKIAVRYLPELAAQMRVDNLAKLLWSFLPEAKLILTSGAPKLILMAEFSAETEEEATQLALSAEEAVRALGVPTRVTQSGIETEKYWTIRRESFNLFRHHVRGRHTAPFIDDVSVSPEFLPEFLPELDAILAQYKLDYTMAGHVGDGNFHIIPLMDFQDPSTKDTILKLSEKVFKLVVRYHGSITGEHNDGLIRSPYLELMYGPAVTKLFADVKQLFDPYDIFNPGKKLAGNLEKNLSALTTNAE